MRSTALVGRVRPRSFESASGWCGFGKECGEGFDGLATAVLDAVEICVAGGAGARVGAQECRAGGGEVGRVWIYICMTGYAVLGSVTGGARQEISASLDGVVGSGGLSQPAWRVVAKPWSWSRSALGSGTRAIVAIAAEGLGHMAGGTGMGFFARLNGVEGKVSRRVDTVGSKAPCMTAQTVFFGMA